MTKMDTLLGGMEHEVTRRDGSTEKVKIRQLPVSLYPAFLAAQDDEPKMVELLCDRPAGWADTIAPEAFEAIVIAGETLNPDFFSRWVQRRLSRQERLIPGITERLAKSAGLPLPIGSPKSPSSAA